MKFSATPHFKEILRVINGHNDDTVNNNRIIIIVIHCYNVTLIELHQFDQCKKNEF